MLTLSILIPFRNRHDHLKVLLSYFSEFNPDFGVEFLVIEGAGYPTLDKTDWPDERFSYIFVRQEHQFHKTQLLNIGLELCRGNYVIAYDVDLIPFGNTLKLSLEAASTSPKLLIAGYRLMSPDMSFHHAVDNLSVAPEDQATALKKYLTGSDKFGISPVFLRSRLVEINGWDAQFIGWGAEDQDMIERYCGDVFLLARLPNLVYIHLHHGLSEGWNNEELVLSNRRYYADKWKK